MAVSSTWSASRRRIGARPVARCSARLRSSRAPRWRITAIRVSSVVWRMTCAATGRRSSS